MSDVTALIANILAALSKQPKVSVLEAIPDDNEEAAWIVKVAK